VDYFKVFTMVQKAVDDILPVSDTDPVSEQDKLDLSNDKGKNSSSKPHA
jgi:hypothetical protein